MRNMPLNRVVAIVASICTLILGLLPVIANLDWTSTAGIIAAIAAITVKVVTWLQGWQKYENNPAVIKEMMADPTDTRAHAHISENDVQSEAF